MKKQLKCSLIITTYNWHKALELVLLSVLKQNVLPNEIIIADDGSDEKTKNLIESFQQKSPVPIIHSWQEDKGFRAAKSRNKAIAKSSYEYIVLIDGDIILHKNFIADHLQFAKNGYFTQGIRAKLSDKKAQEIFANKKFTFKPLEDGIKNKRHSIRSKILSWIFSGTVRFNKLAMLQTCNMAFFKSDCIKINGFNEGFIGWGREDGEFGARLLNTKVKRRNLRCNAIGYHIHHEGNSRNMLDINHQIYLNTLNNNLKWCDNGINKYLKLKIMRAKEKLYLVGKVFLRKFSRKYYSQFGEDIVLTNLFNMNVKNGFYVDVGCFHPKQFSNTYLLYKKGWNGINIDMDELKIKAFNMARKSDVNICCPVSDEVNTITACSYSRYGLTSTIDSDLVDDKNAYNLREMNTDTLTNIISRTKYKNQTIDLLSIDAEGYDFQVLKSLDFETYKPKIIIIELHSLRLKDVLSSEIYLFLVKQGYSLFNWTGLSLIFKRNDDDEFVRSDVKI
jgi:glycosyltransferase involved in cell wall biosynthesis